MSVVTSGAPRNTERGALPNVKGAGAANAVVSNHRATLRLFEGNAGFPTTSGRSAPAGNAFFGANESSVIARIADRGINPRDVAELGKRPARLSVSRSHQLWRNLIQAEIVAGEVMADIADIARFDQNVGRKFALQIQIE